MIRPYKSSDKKELIQILRLNTPKFFDIKEIKDFKKYLDQRANTYFTIEIDDTIIGGVGYYVNKIDNSGRITWLFLNPNYQGQKIGKQAVEYCQKILNKEKSVKKLIVTTSQLAYKFFEKLGYTIHHIEKNYWGEGLDLYKMHKLNK